VAVVTARTHYDVLGVSRRASAEEVRAAYRAKARDHHPDAGGDPAAMRRLNAAWRVLGDPARRAAYDRLLATGGAATAGGIAGTGPGPPGGPGGPGPVGDHAARARAWGGDDLDDLGLTAEEWADLEDGRAVGETMALEGWWAIMPPGTLVAAVLSLGGGIFFVSPPLVALSVGLFVLALGLFVLAPLRAMAKKGGGGAAGDGG
jgi:hypothetical protein